MRLLLLAVLLHVVDAVFLPPSDKAIAYHGRFDHQHKAGPIYSWVMGKISTRFQGGERLFGYFRSKSPARLRIAANGCSPSSVRYLVINETQRRYLLLSGLERNCITDLSIIKVSEDMERNGTMVRFRSTMQVNQLINL